MTITQTVRPLACAGALLATLAACGDSSEPDDAASDGSSSGTDTAAESIDFSGIAGLSFDVTSENEDHLDFTDPETGETQTLVLPSLNADMLPGRTMFSADWQHAVFDYGTADWEVHQFDTETNTYEPLFAVTRPEESFSGGTVRYWNPQFSADGRTLWFEASSEGQPTRLMSIRYTEYEPGDEATDSGIELGAEGSEADWSFDAAGAPILHDDSVEIGAPGDETWARGWMNETGGLALSELYVQGDEARYETVLALSPTELILGYFGTADNTTYEVGGALVRVSFDVEAQTVELETLLPAGAEVAELYLVSPDASQALINIGSDWYRADLTSGAEPELLDGVNIANHQLLGWA